MFRYNRFIGLWLLITLSCKDLKNWHSQYTNRLTIQFKQAMDEHMFHLDKSIHRQDLCNMLFDIAIYNSCNQRIDQKGLEQATPFTLSALLSIALPIDDHLVKVVFKQGNIIHKVSIFYERTVSFISPFAGGLQQQYYIKHIQLDNMYAKTPLFKKYTIEHPILLKGHDQYHVTLYY